MSLGTAVRQLQQQYSTAQIREMIHLYTAAYGNHGLTGRWVLEEMVCDAMGEMNAFATKETSTVAGEVGQFLRDLRKAAKNETQTGQKNNAQEGVKFSRQFLAAEENQDITALAKRVLDGNYKANEKVYLGTVSDRNAARIQEITGINVDGFRVAIEARQIEHILKRHGAEGTADNSMADISNIARIEYALNNPDSIVLAGKTSAYVYMRDGKNRKADTVRYEKGIGEKTYYAVQAVADTKAKTLHIVTAFIGEGGYKKGTPQFTNAISSGVTSENAAVDVPNNNISQSSEDVKQKYSRELDSEYMELAKDPEGNRWELQEMVDQAAEAAGYEYKRNAKRKHSPANDVPWQMFVRGVDKDQGNYGDYTYYATDKGATSIDEIMPKLRELAEEFYGETVSDEEINPPDIVMSAGVWDDMDFVQYAWDNYFEGEMDRTGKVPAVVTEDGMIVIDEDFSRVKSGDTVEYDDNGKVIPLSERFNSDKRDIRYSRELETVEALKRQNEILQKQRDYWKEQTRTTDEKTRGADKGEVRSLAGQLIRQYSSKTEVEEILPEMQWLADSIWRNDQKISYTDLQDSAQNIARMVLDGSEVNLNAENWETGQELKRFLRGRYINVDESLKEDIGDFKNFKRSNRSLHFRENGTGTGVASLWLELQNDFGKGLFPDSISNPGDQIRHIADTLTSLTESDMRNPYAADMELTVEQMAYDVMARAAGLNRQKATKTDNTADSPFLYSVRMLTWAEVSWSMLPSL